MQYLDTQLYQQIQKEQGIRRAIEEKGERGIEPNLLNISNALDTYYVLNKLKVYCFYLSYRQIVQEISIPYKDSDFQLMSPICEWLDRQHDLHPVTDLYNQIRHLYENLNKAPAADDHTFQELLQLAKKHYPLQSVAENLEVLSLLSNYAILQLNRKDLRYDYHFLAVNNDMLRLQYGPGQKKRTKLPASVFKNMIVVALRLENPAYFYHMGQIDGVGEIRNAHDWVACFLEQYKFRLKKKDRKTYYPYCKAMLEFKQGSYTKAYRTLQHPSGTREMFINLNIKVLYLQILYEVFVIKPSILETDEVEIEKVAESMRGMIRYESHKRKQVSYQLQYFKEFAKLFRKLYQLRLLYHDSRWLDERTAQQKYRALKKLVEMLDHGYQGWFLEKLGEMKEPASR
jgi:hypothetical protein